MSLIEDLTRAIDIQQARQNSDYKELMQKPLAERVAKGYTIPNIDIKVEFSPYISGFVEKVFAKVQDNYSKFRVGDQVFLCNGGIKLTMKIEEDLINDLVLSSNDFWKDHNFLDEDDYPKHGWIIEKEHLTITQELLSASRDSIMQNSELCRRMDSMLHGGLRSTYSRAVVQPSNNVSQDEAVEKALGCSTFHLIQGPPGTGKTYTLARIVKTLLLNGKKVFVTAPTHTAINNSLNAISKEVPDMSKIVKLGDKHQAEEILGNTFISRATKLPFSQYLNLSDRLSQSGIVIGATPFALCTPRSKKLDGWFFDYVIIDEAAQMSMPLALAAMTRGQKIIFVGDHKQLDPIMPSGTGNWLFSKSIFKYMVDMYPDNVTMLNRSYRLSESLVRIPSQLFYDGRLKTARNYDNREYLNFDCSGEVATILHEQSNEVLYLHHEFDALGRSPYEAKLTASLVSSLLDNGITLEKIAIITPYRAQVREIKKALMLNHIINEDSLDAVFVDTIERMQGQERDYVIFTLANSNPSEVEDRLEFFYSPNRLNVAITRAKTKCIVIANEKVFQLCRDSRQTGLVGVGQKAYWDFFNLSTKIYDGGDPDEDQW